MHRGKVKWFNSDKGYGFIKRDDGHDVFVHVKELQKTGLQTLIDDQRVEFDVAPGKKGDQAVNVRLAA